MKQIRTETGICHFRVAEEMDLSAFLQIADLSELALQPDAALAHEWMWTGSVYVDGVRTRVDRALQPGQVIRLHTRRKRYPVAAMGGWRARIVFENENFLVFDKPSGLPTHPTLDNFVENAKYVLEQELGHPLFVTHRLDIPTAGLLVIAKTAAAQSRINKAFARGQVEKIYQTLAAKAVASGLYTHFIDPEAHVPRPITTDVTKGWWECRLNVEAEGPHTLGHWHRVRLLTGKTHQIRAQFAAVGAPLLGDTLYGGAESGVFGLECYELALPLDGENFRFQRPRSLLL